MSKRNQVAHVSAVKKMLFLWKNYTSSSLITNYGKSLTTLFSEAKVRNLSANTSVTLS
jgi:hypothetical protein